MATDTTQLEIPDDLDPGDRIEIDPPAWTGSASMVVQSRPSTDHVGLFHEGILGTLATHPEDEWMFTARTCGDADVLIVGAADVAYVAFSHVAAAAGAVHLIATENISRGGNRADL